MMKIKICKKCKGIGGVHRADYDCYKDYSYDVVNMTSGEIINSLFINVTDEEPKDSSCRLLVKDPEGVLHLTSWRSAYRVFDCQDKWDSTIGWSYIVL